MRSHLLAAFHDVSLLSQLIAGDTHHPKLPHECVSLRVGTHLRARLPCLGKLFTWAATATWDLGSDALSCRMKEGVALLGALQFPEFSQRSEQPGVGPWPPLTQWPQKIVFILECKD